ncbi:MAG TPA: transposase [Polyangiaceae bacterium]|nr:transposase [Polyangiaceae bacterium]
MWEFVPARFVRVEHLQEVLRGRCNGFVVTAPGAPKVVETGQYGASFLAHLAEAKCADHTPVYRLEKAFQRQGIPVARSTMNELLHRASAILEPVWSRLLDVVRVRPVVAADETRLRIVRGKTGKTKNGFVWTFGARDDTAASTLLTSSPRIAPAQRRRSCSKARDVAWRIRIWLEGTGLEHVSWVDYELHPEYGAVRRRATYLVQPEDGHHFRHWVNTFDDFWIRIRCNDGIEVGCWLSAAIAKTHQHEPAKANACLLDLVKEAEQLRGKEYEKRSWCDSVEITSAPTTG